MGWMNMLYQTYENNTHMVGKEREGANFLCPMAHIVANAQLEITLNQNAELSEAREVDKDNSSTLIPVTESSAGRSSGIAPHALSDTLSYIAGDYSCYISNNKDIKKADEKFQSYIQQLEKWLNSEYRRNKIEIIYRYLQRKCMIKDLIKSEILKCDETGKLQNKKINGTAYEKVLVRFRVQNDFENEIEETWRDNDLIEAYTKYYISNQDGKKDVCYLSGTQGMIAVNHPKGIISANYGAKLISANDESGFTYRGRFISSDEACTIGYEATQKAHSALTWLANMQGVMTIGNKDKRTYICWNPKGKEINFNAINPFELEDDNQNTPNTAETYGKSLRNALQGKEINKLEDNDDILIIGLDAATTGRLSIIYYNELKASDFLNRLQYWGESCCWYFRDYSVEKGNKIHCPSILQIVKCAYGVERENEKKICLLEVNDKTLKEQSQRLLYCMLDCKPIPLDLISALLAKCSYLMTYSKSNREMLLSTACALICKAEQDRNQKREEKKMILDKQNTDRSYLFGRLLAIAEKVERGTYDSDESREPNAMRLQAAYVNHPLQVWKTLEEALIPYYQKMGSSKLVDYYKNEITQIFSLLREDDYEKLNCSLDGTYLLGYYLQREDLYTAKKEKSNAQLIED